MAPLFIRQTKSESDENKDSTVFSVCGIFIFLSSAGIAARMVSKRIKRTKFHIDDVLIIWAYILSIAETVMIAWGKAHDLPRFSVLADDKLFIAAKNAGIGHHLATLSKEQIVTFEKVSYSGTLMQPCLLASAKLSVLILLHRIFITQTSRTIALALMAIVTSWWIAITWAAAFICFPLKSRWNPDVPGHCGNQHLFHIIDPILWILTDFAILFTPMPMVWKLQMPIRQKIALCGLFLLGGLTCIVSCVRYRYTFYSFSDPTWELGDLAYWNVIEAHVTVLCVCLIASKPVFMVLIPERPFSRTRSYFTRAKQYLGSLIKASYGPTSNKDNSESRTYLPRNGASFELQRNAKSLQIEGTKTSHVINNDAISDDSQNASRPV